MKNQFVYTFEQFASLDELGEHDLHLLQMAQQASRLAYAPYSRFRVGAVARLVNGETLNGTNLENASFPAGICAERVLLSALSAIHPKEPIDTIAISYSGDDVESDHYIAPCGICRQSLVEYEQRLQHPIRLILGGLTGPVIVIDSVSFLLPLAFTNSSL
ncbi:MAG TPA: cytidine deaminase [Puia sp.]|nr:cytidine deaminase [Puia sp.]